MKYILTLGSEYFVYTLLPNNMRAARYGIVVIPIIYVGRYSVFLWAKGFVDSIPGEGGGLDFPHRSRPALGPTQGWDKTAGVWLYHPPPTSAEIKERI